MRFKTIGHSASAMRLFFFSGSKRFGISNAASHVLGQSRTSASALRSRE
jgi:hypothetical protein